MTSIAQPGAPARDPLPPAARRKLVAFEGEAVDARDAASSAQRRITELQAALQHGDAPPSDAGPIEHEVWQLQGIRDRANQRHRELGALTAALGMWLKGLPRNVVLEPVRPTAVKLLKGETVMQALVRTRDDIAASQDHLRLVQSLPLPRADIKEQVRGYVQALAARGRPKISTDRGEFRANFVDERSASFSATRATSLLAWFDPDQMVARLEAEIDAQPELTMTAAEKETRAGELVDILALLARREEALVQAAVAEGQDVLRRPNADPAAVLGVTKATKKSEAA